MCEPSVRHSLNSLLIHTTEMKKVAPGLSTLDHTKYPFPLDLLEVRGRMPGQDCAPPLAKTTKEMKYTVTDSHVLTPVSPTDDHASPLRSSPVSTPPPRFPSPAQLRAQRSTSASPVPTNSDDPFASDESPSSKASSKAEEDKVARSDSLKKLRQATLRRKQAFERL